MGISISEQALEFLAACLLGAGIGVLYDVFRILRIAFKHGRIITIAEDLLFWILSAVITFFFLLLFSEGQVRVYILLGELLGFTVYYFSLGCLVMRFSEWIIHLIKRLLKLLYKLLISPFVKLFSFIFRRIKGLVTKIDIKLKKLKQNSKKCLPNRDNLLYNQNSILNNTNSRQNVKVKRAKLKKRKKENTKWQERKKEKISC